MALTGTQITVQKEYNYAPTKTSFRLVAGFEQDELKYWAVEHKSGDPLDEEFEQDTELFDASQYGEASDYFRKLVGIYL